MAYKDDQDRFFEAQKQLDLDAKDRDNRVFVAKHIGGSAKNVIGTLRALSVTEIDDEPLGFDTVPGGLTDAELAEWAVQQIRARQKP